MTADSAVAPLYINVRKSNDKKSEELLMELAGNYMNKLAFNALNSLGRMAPVTDSMSKRGFAEYMIDAWKSSDSEKLQILAFWSYPSFTYTEFDTNGSVIKEINDEEKFVNHLLSEMRTAHLRGEKIHMRLGLENEDDYFADIMVGSRISTFKFLYGKSTFLGIERYFRSSSYQ